MFLKKNLHWECSGVNSYQNNCCITEKNSIIVHEIIVLSHNQIV